MTIKHRPINRITPQMPTWHYKTYSVRTPLTTHFRKATCEEADCLAYRNGWTIALTGIDPKMEYLAKHSGRKWREEDGAPHGLVGKFLVFEPGQQCFNSSTHVISLERPEIYLVGRGDWRSFSPRNAKQHTRPEHWVEDMSEHLDGIRKIVERG